MYRFFVSPEQIAGEQIVITGDDVNHIKNVLRMKPGESVRISAGSTEDYLCVIESLESQEILLRIESQEESAVELPADIYLFQGLPKGDKMELIIQKAVELGARGVIPVAMKRSVVKLDAQKAASRVKRWNAISESAAKQSGRLQIPEVSMPVSFSQALAMAADFEWKILPYENAEGMEGLRSYMTQIAESVKAESKAAKPVRIGVFIGPEGGFDEKEVEQAAEAGWKSISLGRRILRTETAGLAALSMLVYVLEP